jgi:hypothetical protein
MLCINCRYSNHSTRNNSNAEHIEQNYEAGAQTLETFKRSIGRRKKILLNHWALSAKRQSAIPVSRWQAKGNQQQSVVATEYALAGEMWVETPPRCPPHQPPWAGYASIESIEYASPRIPTLSYWLWKMIVGDHSSPLCHDAQCLSPSG